MEIFSEIQRGCTYAGYHPWLGHTKADEVRADFTKKYGYEPAEVLWCKPGMWMAGPIEPRTGAKLQTKPATASAVEANAIAAAPDVEAPEPADSVTPTGPDSQTQPIQLSLV